MILYCSFLWHSNLNLESKPGLFTFTLCWTDLHAVLKHCFEVSLFPAWLFIYLSVIHQIFVMLPDVVDSRLHNLCSLSPCLTESVDWENNPDPLPSSSWDLPLGGGGKERSGEELKRSSYTAHAASWGTGSLKPCAWGSMKCVYVHIRPPLLSGIKVNVSLNSQVEVSPLENAIYVVENKTQELRTLISQYQHRQHHGNINPLSMCLNGVIDAAVNGGIARYQEVEREMNVWIY